MRRAAPLLVLTAVVSGTVLLAVWTPFAPSAPAVSSGEATGDVYRGETVFQGNCAGCHGDDASGGVGPPLRGAGLTPQQVLGVLATGQGSMPAGVVSGRDAADVAAYVSSLDE
jgi:mono/diheme cytochrome c family protein